jgi:glycogen synthase
MEAKADFFFEVSWEVCNKVGGINTVITSKIEPMIKYYKENYYAIGPYFPGRTKQNEFREKLPPAMLKDVFEKLHKIGIICHYGEWAVEGEPKTILIDYTNYTYKLNQIKADLWVDYKIDSMGTQFHDYDEPTIWSTCAGILLQEIKENLPDTKIVAQFHEWLAGGGLLYLKSKNVRIGKVFTTHATMLGRTLAANHVDLYGLLDKLNPEERAYEFNIQAKHHTEKACAQHSDAFTTVSEITGIEATHFLGKKPDILLPNGLDIEKFPTFDEASVKHKMLKTKLKKFMMYYFFPYYQFDLDNALTYFLAGRYEYHDKGMDIFIKALGILNKKLREEKSDRTIFALLLVPAGVKDIRPEIMENRAYFEDIEESFSDSAEQIKEKVIHAMLSSKEINKEFVFGKSLLKEVERKVARFSRVGSPPLCTHNLYNEDTDETLNGLKENGLTNSEEDRVKVVFYPIYLTGADQLIDLSYYDTIMAGHLGVFPSYYEPWGYTPMETGALGVASVTTDLAGFGRYLQNIAEAKKNQGIYVLERLNKPEEEYVEELYQILYSFAHLSKQDRIENKLRAKRLADTADWKILAENYIKAHNMALDKNG